MKIEEILQPLVQIHSGKNVINPSFFLHPKPRDLISKPVFSWAPIVAHRWKLGSMVMIIWLFHLLKNLRYIPGNSAGDLFGMVKT